jgi:ankyrin repeat protein
MTVHLAKPARGSVPLMELAIGCGAHVDARDRGGCTPLHLAARNDRVDAASLLINCGADVDARGGRDAEAEETEDEPRAERKLADFDEDDAADDDFDGAPPS